jgi:hypothetical protein
MRAFAKPDQIVTDNIHELWEINYTAGHALDVSEITKSGSLKNNVTRYSGTIEDFLTKERECRNISFHDSMNLPTSVHLKGDRSANHSCTFNPNKKTQSQEQVQGNKKDHSIHNMNMHKNSSFIIQSGHWDRLNQQ